MKKPKLFKQEKSYSCTVACLRMVLQHYGIEEDEKTLRKKSKTRFYGTHPVNVVECANLYGLKTDVSSITLGKLQELVNQNIPVIANILKFVDDDFYIHSIVVYRVEKDLIYLLDPEDGEMHFKSDLFERLWQGTEYTAIIIEKP